MARRGGVKQRPWSDLPNDLLAAIYLRCFLAYDRARFAAVCTSWRATASWHPAMPPLPLLFSWTGDRKRDRKTRVYSPMDGRALCVLLPRIVRGKKFVGSYDGGWIAATSTRDSQLLVVNLFSRVQVALSANQRSILYACPNARPRFEALANSWTSQAPVAKVIFFEDPTSSGCIHAAITQRCKLALCRVGCPDNGWTTRGCSPNTERVLVHIAFCNGQLFGLMPCGWELYKYDIGMNKDGAPVVTSVQHMYTRVQRMYNQIPTIYKHEVTYNANCIFELCGKLAIALDPNVALDCSETCFFKVFELRDDTTPCENVWAEVTTLGDYALFLGPKCSKVVHVSTTGRHGRLEKNRIYCYHCHYSKLTSYMGYLTRLDLGSCDVYREKQRVHHRKIEVVHQCLESR